MIVIVSVISIVAMLFAVFAIYFLAAQALVVDYGFTSVGMQAFTDMMMIDEFSQEFTGNLLMTLFYTVLGIVFEISRLAKSIKRQGTIN